MTQYKLTPQDLENQIKEKTYFRISETGILCVLTLQNGYTVNGDSGCIDPQIFDEEIGKKIAYENAFEKLWQILGYGVKQRWHEETQLTWLERLRKEHAELNEKRTKLAEMLEKPKPDFVLQIQWSLMQKQYEVMAEYSAILFERIENAEGKK